MSEIAMYIMVIAALGIGIMVISKRFVKKHRSQEYRYIPKKHLQEVEEPLAERINFRKKPFEKKQSLPDPHISFRESYNKATHANQRNYQPYLSRTFWWVLLALLTIVVAFIFL